MPVNHVYSNIYLAQVDEETVEPGAKIAGFHTLLYDCVNVVVIPNACHTCIIVLIFGFVYKMHIVT
jgi:hypothetical protein